MKFKVGDHVIISERVDTLVPLCLERYPIGLKGKVTYISHGNTRYKYSVLFKNGNNVGMAEEELEFDKEHIFDEWIKKELSDEN